MKKYDKLIKYIILSVSALFLILIIGFFSQPDVVTPSDKLIVGGVFILSLLFGITLAIYPGWYKKQKKNGRSISKKMTSVKYIAHHPNCECFKNHILTIKNKTYCAGCLGLIIGSIITIVLILFYLLLDILKINNILYLIYGIILIPLLFTTSIFHNRNQFLRVFSNSILVISFFIVIISILEITGSFIYGLLTGLFSFLLIDTRIHISKWSHIKTCRNCKKECKMY